MSDGENGNPTDDDTGNHHALAFRGVGSPPPPPSRSKTLKRTVEYCTCKFSHTLQEGSIRMHDGTVKI
jgi:hypothetical protein